MKTHFSYSEYYLWKKSKPLTLEEENAVVKLAADTDLERMTTPRPYKEIMEIIGEDFPDAPEEGEEAF